MVAFKFTFLFAALFLGSANSLPNQKQAFTEGSILDVVKKIVHYVENLLDKFLFLVTDAVNQMSDNWELYRIKILNNARTVITAALKRGRPFLDRIAEDASDSGKNLIKCIEDSENHIMGVPVTFLDRVTKCFKDDVVNLVKSLGPLVQDLVSVQDEAKAVADKVDACEGDDVEGIICVVDVATDLMAIVSKLAETISQDLAPIKDVVDKAIQKIVQCNKDKMELFYNDAGKVLSKIATCAAP